MYRSFIWYNNVGISVFLFITISGLTDGQTDIISLLTNIWQLGKNYKHNLKMAMSRLMSMMEVIRM